LLNHQENFGNQPHFNNIFPWRNDENLPNKTLGKFFFVFLKECTGENIVKNVGKI